MTMPAAAIMVVALVPSLALATQPPEPDLLLADFEGADYGEWKTTGTAFGPGPAQGTLPGQMQVSGYLGRGLVNSFFGGDQATGTLTSPEFAVSRRFIKFLVGGGGWEGQTCMNLLIDGQVVRTVTGPNREPGGSEKLEPAHWDVSEFVGRRAQIQVVDQATGGWGHINVDHIVQSDSPPPVILRDAKRELTAEKRYLNFPVKAGAAKCFINVAVGGETVRDFDIELAVGEPDWWASLDISAWRGRRLTLTVDRIPEDSTGLTRIEPSDALPGGADVYRERWRPQFHFTPRRGWTNDPNGLVYYRGEWHLFFQHNPYGCGWGNMHWGHAVSPDLCHWRELGEALYPDPLGTMFSGSAVVDHHNTAGFQAGPEKALVAVFTAAGGCSRQNRGAKFSQGLAFSTDAGRTWTKYAGNPVLPNLPEDIDGNRDPKVIWHEPTRQWVMALYVGLPDPDRKDAQGKPARLDTIHFFASQDLKQWTFLSRLPGYYECPDFFELPVDGKAADRRWVVYAANGHYATGQFDGSQFTPDGDRKQLWFGRFYAAQTYDSAPAGRRVQIGWANGISFPGMPFNQQMTVPVELSLRTTPSGIRLFAWPVREIEGLRAQGRALTSLAVEPGTNRLAAGGGAECLDLSAEFAVGTATRLGLDVRGTPVVWDAASQTLACGSEKAPLAAEEGMLRLRILVDRGSLEVFGNGGAVAVSVHALHDPANLSVATICEGGAARLSRFESFALRSVWSGF